MSRGWEACVAGIENGDYVLATKYRDGDPREHWCVGMFAGEITAYAENGGPPRYKIVDGDGIQFRHNGFRRVKSISAELGDFMIRNKELIESGGLSVWGYARMSKSTRDKMLKGGE